MNYAGKIEIKQEIDENKSNLMITDHLNEENKEDNKFKGPQPDEKIQVVEIIIESRETDRKVILTNEIISKNPIKEDEQALSTPPVIYK